MIQNVLLYANRALLVIMLLGISASANAQFGYNAKSNNLDNFLKTQWWLGITGGINFSQPIPGERFSSIYPIDYAVDSLKKSYQNFTLPGVHVGLDITFYHQGIAFSIQPMFKQMRYEYSRNLRWEGSSSTELFETRYNAEQRLNYLELPFSLTYEIVKSGKVRPFAGGGAHFSLRLGAEKKLDIVNTDYITGVGRESDGGSVISDIGNQFQNYFGVFGKVGSAFDYFEVRTILTVNYYHALTTIADNNNRFDVTELTSLGEVNDEVKLNNLSISLSLVFPLRFIDNTFQSR